MESPAVLDKVLIQCCTPTYRFGAEVQAFANEMHAPTLGAEIFTMKSSKISERLKAFLFLLPIFSRFPEFDRPHRLFGEIESLG